MTSPRPSAVVIISSLRVTFTSTPPASTRMDVADAAALIATAVPRRGEVWADLGAGDGIFSRALTSLLGPDGRVYAVDRDAHVVRLMEVPGIIPVHGDFRQPLALPDLDGALFANSLHFVEVDGQAAVLRSIAHHVLSRGVIVIVEYDGRPPSRWVPAPVPFARLVVLARDASLGAPRLIGSRRSAFGGMIYAASMHVNVD